MITSLLLSGLMIVHAAPATQPAHMDYLADNDVSAIVKTLRGEVDGKTDTDALRRVADESASQLAARPAASARAEAIANDTESDVARLRAAMEALAADLAFKPTNEAPTARGWPPFTPVGEMELKAYPAYRVAVVANDRKLPDGIAFMRLFGHIQRNEIAMTAPVEMEMDKADDVNAPMTMAFVYENTDLGTLGKDGAVTVQDIAPRLAITVGLRGETNPADSEKAAARIAAWLTEHADEYEPAGPIRVLGYNSPSLKTAAKYWEVQRVVREKE